MDRSDVQETLVSLYLRLNGYFLNGFIVHASHGVGTEMDVLAVRFPRHQEPEREVQCCDRLAIPANHIDFIIGEVKGGSNNVTFNVRFRECADAIRSVLQRFGAFADTEIERLCRDVPSVLLPETVRRSAAFPGLDVTTCAEIGAHAAKIRFIPFATEQRRDDGAPRPYVFVDDLLMFAWRCFQADGQRPLCATHYNYNLWGPQFEQLVRFFKDRTRTTAPASIEEIYTVYGV